MKTISDYREEIEKVYVRIAKLYREVMPNTDEINDCFEQLERLQEEQWDLMEKTSPQTEKALALEELEQILEHITKDYT